MNKIKNISIDKPFKDQKPGTSGLRKSTLQFQEPHYLEIFVESVLRQIKDIEGSTLIVGGDGRYGNIKAIKKIIQMCAAHNVGKINFAKFLNDKNIVMYSAYWCPHCNDQKQLFGKKAVEELIIVECAKDGKNNQYNLCQEKGIEGFPSWEINNKIYSGTMSLNELAEMTNYDGDINFE